MITPRPYQSEAHTSLDEHLRTKQTNPCVVIPTGGGKSFQMAYAIQNWKALCPTFRVCVLAHRKELVEQNSQEMNGIAPEFDIGIYSAGLNRKDKNASVIFASIDSIWNKADQFMQFDCLIVDEAHRIPAKGEGKYRSFINACRRINPNLVVIGFTATPFRMGCGPICHKSHILQEICYEANVGDLIRDGYLCKLRSKVGEVQPDLSNVDRNARGDYKTASLATAVDKGDIVSAAVRSAVGHIVKENRKSVVWFCVDIDHCHRVQAELAKYGVDAPVVTSKTPAAERDRIARSFKLGVYSHIINVNVYTEGFNSRNVDCIVILRPTLSKGLFIQMCGRGLRTHPDKIDCLILDYASCIAEHGPIDCPDTGFVRVIECLECGDVFSRAVGTCPNCGWVIPKREVERHEAEQREKRMHEAEASKLNILSQEPEVMPVDGVSVHRHVKAGKPDSIRVQYRSGLQTFSEWVCPDHEGPISERARNWWFARFRTRTVTVNSALEDLFLADAISNLTESITVRRNGKFFEIVSHKFRKNT
jgi:DNA repair protein RadD